MNDKCRLISSHDWRSHEVSAAHFCVAVIAVAIALSYRHVPKSMMSFLVIHCKRKISFHGGLIKTGKSFTGICWLKLGCDNVFFHSAVSIGDFIDSNKCSSEISSPFNFKFSSSFGKLLLQLDNIILLLQLVIGIVELAVFFDRNGSRT